MSNIEYKKSIIESSLASAKLYYDDRVKYIELAAKEASIENDLDINLSQSNEINTSAYTLIQNNGLSLTSFKKRLSSKKNKKNSLQELKINEENESDFGSNFKNNEHNDLINEDMDDYDLNHVNYKMSPNEIAKHLVNKIDRKVQLLDRLWQELNRQSLNYNNSLLNFNQNLQLIHKSFEVVNQKLNENEQILTTINPISEIDSEKLADELERVKNFQLNLSSYQPLIDDMCNKYVNINQEMQHFGSICTNSMFNTKFDDLKTRWLNLQNQFQEKYLHMYSLIESCGASIFLKLADSVKSPWQRGISINNKVPYYIKYDFRQVLKLFIYLQDSILKLLFKSCY